MTKLLDELNDLFENEVKKIINDDDWSSLCEEIQSNYTIQCVHKKDFNDENFSKHDIKKAKRLNGKSIITVYENNVPKFIDGRWDSCDKIPIVTKRGIRIAIYTEKLGGFIDTNDKIIAKPKYTNIKGCDGKIDIIDEKFFWVQKGTDEYTYGLITTEGKEVTPFNFFISGKQFFKFYQKEYIKGQTKQGECVFNLAEKKYTIKQGEYKNITIHEKYRTFCVKNKKGKVGMIHEGKITIPIIYDILNVIDKHKYQATLNKKIGIIDINNKILIPIKYEKIIKYQMNDLQLLDEALQVHKYNLV